MENNVLQSKELKCEAQIRVSQKTGNKYLCYVITFANGSTRMIMPESNFERDIVVQQYKLDEFYK